MNMNLEQILEDLGTRRERIRRWYKLSPYQFERCMSEVDAILNETTRLLSFLRDNLDQRDADMRKTTRGLMSDIEEIKSLKQEMQEYKNISNYKVEN